MITHYSLLVTLQEKIMKYLCLIFFDEKELEVLSQRESDALNAASLAYDETLRQSGHFLDAHALQSVQAATTVRVRHGKLSITDGPFAETHEQLGGFVLIEAADLDDAIRVAVQIPSGRLGCVE